MAEERTNPYIAFNFQVEADGIAAGFQEVSGLNMEVNLADYRNGNEAANHVRKVIGMHSFGDVTLKRGLIGAMDLWEWIRQARDGEQEAARSVTVQMYNEAHTQVVMTWRLTNARPMRYTAPSLNAQSGTEVAIEELVLSIEAMEIE